VRVVLLHSKIPILNLLASRFPWMPPNIPQDLIDFINDFLEDDIKSFKACSLTCRAWVNTRRYVTVDMGSPSSVPNLLYIIQSNPTVASNKTEFQLKAPTATKPPGMNGTAIETQDIKSLISGLPRVSTLICPDEIETSIDYIHGLITSERQHEESQNQERSETEEKRT
jgi:hypothetical protein